MDHPGSGLVKTTLLDYPGKVAAVVFTAGCNLRCPWCQNPGLVRAPWDEGLLSDDKVLAFLAHRRPVLGGVVVTGGEPLFRSDLADFLDRIKSLEYPVKLDTNGSLPDRLAQVAPGRVDYLALDLKNAPSAYARSTGVPVAADKLRRSLDVLEERYPGASEVRLTWVPGLNEMATLDEYAAFVGPRLPVWVQSYRPGPVLDPTFAAVRAPTPGEIDAVVAGLRNRGVDARRRA